jgi:hypothetical protein
MLHCSITTKMAIICSTAKSFEGCVNMRGEKTSFVFLGGIILLAAVWTQWSIFSRPQFQLLANRQHTAWLYALLLSSKS